MRPIQRPESAQGISVYAKTTQQLKSANEENNRTSYKLAKLTKIAQSNSNQTYTEQPPQLQKPSTIC